MAETAIPVLKDRHKWLLRLIYVRMVAFTIFLAAEATRNPTADVLVLLAVVYALSACWFALLKLNRSYVAQSYVQIALDLHRQSDRRSRQLFFVALFPGDRDVKHPA